MQKEQYVPTGKGLIALSPLMVFLMMYVGLSIFVGDFYTVPLSVAFVLSSVWGVRPVAVVGTVEGVFQRRGQQ